MGEIHVTAREFSNANQTDPLYARGGSAHGSCGADDPRDALTVASESWILSLVASSTGGSHRLAITGGMTTLLQGGIEKVLAASPT